MTDDTKLKQTIASAESVAANLHSFSLNTDNQQAKQTFSQLAQNMDSVVQQLKTREQQVTSEAPQYMQGTDI